MIFINVLSNLVLITTSNRISMKQIFIYISWNKNISMKLIIFISSWILLSSWVLLFENNRICNNWLSAATS